MNRILRWLLRGVLAAFALAAAGLGLAWVLISGSLPRYDGEVRAAGLGAPVEVIRDANAIPHIRAESAHDAWFALGLVHAQDRLWQMEVNRRAAQGRLSALFGPRTVPLDRLVKTLDLYGYARRAVEHQDREVRAALEAYSAGVNAWIRHVDANSLGRGAPEFFLFGDGFAPWTPADSIGILKVMALRLSAAARSEVRRALFQLELEPGRVADILPEHPSPAQTTVPRFSELFPGARFAGRPARARDPLLAALGPPEPGTAGASNAWAVDASRSASGAPLLANDPHLWLSAPSVWYLAGLSGGDVRAIGGTLPGVPAVLIGHNGRLGWGLSTAQVDDQDLYIERVNPADPSEYLTPIGWRSFETRQIRIEVADAPPILETVRRTRHGPVLSGEMFGASAVTPEGHVAALGWTALEDRDRGLTSLHRMLAARTVEQGIEAAREALAPAQVVTFADGRNVGMTVAGRIPRRAEDSPGKGRIPAPGWKSANDWQGWLPAEKVPTVIRPEEGAVAHANSRLTDAAYPEHLSFDWDAPYRMRRIDKELSGRRFHSRGSFVALQADTVSEMARSVLPLIARDLWWREGAHAGGEGLRAEALGLLAEWNGEMDQHSPEPLIFSEWMRRLTVRLAADELGALATRVQGPQPLFVERVFRDIDGASVWCDVDKTPETETCDEIAAAALDDALAALAAEHGRQIAGWRWGEAHVAVHRHVPLGHVGAARVVVNIEQETSGGDHTLMRGLSPGDGERPFENVHASGLRMVLDFADLDRSVVTISTGQSGHPFSRWYDHLAEPWARGDVVPMSMNPEDARSGAVGEMRLLPD
jgi:penicillin amidase